MPMILHHGFKFHSTFSAIFTEDLVSVTATGSTIINYNRNDVTSMYVWNKATMSRSLLYTSSETSGLNILLTLW